MRALLILALLALPVFAALPAQACSLTGTPTGCVTEVYRVEKNRVSAAALSFQGWSQVALVQVGACGDVRAGPPPGPGSNMFTDYGADVQGEAGAFQQGFRDHVGPATAALLGNGYGRTVGLVLAVDGAGEALLLEPLPGRVDGALREPAAGLAGGTAGAQAYAGAMQDAGGAALLCARQVTPPDL